MEVRRYFTRGQMLTFLFDKTDYFFRKLTFLHQSDALVRFFSRLLYQKIQLSTKGLPLCPPNVSHSISEVHSSHSGIHIMLKNLLGTSPSYFVYKLSCLYFCNIMYPKRSTIEMTSRITLLHSHVYIDIFR